jgi:AcrR family transcriptional regulator
MYHDWTVKRKYELKERAKSQEATRRRIVEAAIELHRTLGPARTSVSAIAERAGVQRHTFYRHFPDERSLGLACSGLYSERNPLPDPAGWRRIEDAEQRLRKALTELYLFYGRNEEMLANVTRDSETDPLVRELTEFRFGPGLAAIRESLAEVLPRRHRKADAALDLALDFQTWRRLVRSGGLTEAQAAGLMAHMTLCAAGR